MNLVDQGAGPALVVIPGLQGRWEYVAAAVHALSRQFRVITFPLCDEPSSGDGFDPKPTLDAYVEQVRQALDQCAVESAIVCGISFGGLIALRFAAVYPARTTGLVLASVPGPAWHLRKRHEIYARLPYVFGPLFLAEAPWRLRREMAASYPELGARCRFAGSQIRTLLRAPLSLVRMGRRARLIGRIDLAALCDRVTTPTLIVTGERGLDHVVSVDHSSGYLSLIRGARGVVLERTGHLGSITRPERFAQVLSDFANRGAREVA
jgi:3-oxoadipate enol-lactonase